MIIDRLEAQMRAMQMLTKSQDVTADNLANINTPGFKGNKVFYHMLTRQVDGKEVTETVPMEQVDMRQGILEPTGNDFDFGINGEGFFLVQDENGSFLTRDGRFHIDSNGDLVNSQNAKVIGSGGPIHIPEYFQAMGQEKSGLKLEVAQDGTIRINDEVYDKLRVVKVDDLSHLERRGNSYFTVDDSGKIIEDKESAVMQGYYEKGNVEPLNEMVNMTRTMQMFESQQRAIRSTDEMLSQVTSKLGRF